MDWTSKKVLVTGGAGFIGSNIARRLVELGATVTVLESFVHGLREQIPYGVRLIEGDTRDPKAYDQVGPVDYVFHFGAPSSIVLFNQDLAGCVDNTISGFLRVLEYATKTGVKHVVYPSSGSIYGTAPSPQSETTVPEPVNSYGKTKYACEWIANAWEGSETKLTGLRIFAGFGPGEEFKGEFASVITLFADAIEQGKAPVIFGDGTQVRDFVHIDDVVASALAVVDQGYTGVLNVGTGEQRSFNDVVASINRVLGTDVKPEYVPKPPKYLEATGADISRMKELLGRDPLTLDEGIARYLKHRQRT